MQQASSTGWCGVDGKAVLRLAMIIPVYNGRTTLEHCLESIRASRLAPDEFWVVADADTDGSRDLARAAGVNVLVLDERGGPSVARNAGAAATEADLLFFIDADVTLHPATIGQVKAHFAADPTLTAVIGSYDDAPAMPDFLSQYRNLLHHYHHQRAQPQAATFWGACGAVRRSAFEAVGGFDPDPTLHYIEDIELGYRLTDAGYNIRLDPAIQVKHWKCWTVQSIVRTDFFHRALPWTRLLQRAGTMRNDLNIDHTNRLSVALLGMLLLSLVGTVLFPPLMLLAGGCVGGLLWLNRDLYRFFAQKRGWVFALRVIPWHWTYFFYSGLAFVIGTVQVRLAQGRSAASPNGTTSKR